MGNVIKPTSETLSLQADAFLDELGYSADRVKDRILTMDKCSAAKCISTQNITKRDDIIKTFVGSQREGTGMSFVNDTDVLQIYTSVRCIEDDNNITLDDNFVVFLLENTKAPAGHSLLQLLNPESKSLHLQELTYALENIDGKIYLSSEKFMQRNDDVFATGNGSIANNTHYMDRKGPSIPKYTENNWWTKLILYKLKFPFIQEYDFVRGFPCHCPSIIRRWKLRSRKYNWPTVSDIEIASNLPACVVPVGEKESENQHMQWRVCFPLAEMHLMKSMNNTHTKVLVLLKMIAKYYLQLECEDISSYVIKNVMFWMAEETPSDNYRPEYLINRLTEALTFLKDCIHKKELKNYMIPERNLFVGKLAGNTGEILVKKLNNLVDNIMTYAQIMLGNDIPKEMKDIINLQQLADRIDKMEAYKVSAVSSTHLSKFYEYAVHAETGLELQLLHTVCILPFCFLKFGLELLKTLLHTAHQKGIGNDPDVTKSLQCTVWQSHANRTEQTNGISRQHCEALLRFSSKGTTCTTVEKNSKLDDTFEEEITKDNLNLSLTELLISILSLYLHSTKTFSMTEWLKHYLACFEVFFLSVKIVFIISSILYILYFICNFSKFIEGDKERMASWVLLLCLLCFKSSKGSQVNVGLDITITIFSKIWVIISANFCVVQFIWRLIETVFAQEETFTSKVRKKVKEMLDNQKQKTKNNSFKSQLCRLYHCLITHSTD